MVINAPLCPLHQPNPPCFPFHGCFKRSAITSHPLPAGNRPDLHGSGETSVRRSRLVKELEKIFFCHSPTRGERTLVRARALERQWLNRPFNELQATIVSSINDWLELFPLEFLPSCCRRYSNIGLHRCGIILPRNFDISIARLVFPFHLQRKYF